MSWFLVLELDGATRSWPDSFVGSAKVLVKQAATLDDLKLSGSYRLSPIFPVNHASWASKAPLPGTSETIIEFHDVPSGFSALPRLTAKLAGDDLRPFAFSIGTVPLLSMSDAGPLYDTVAETVGVEYPYERWTVGPDGLLQAVHARPYHPHEKLPEHVDAIVRRCESLATSRDSYGSLPRRRSRRRG